MVWWWGSYARVSGDGAKGRPAPGDLAFGPILHGADARLEVANTSPLLHWMLLTPARCRGAGVWTTTRLPRIASRRV